MRDGLIQYFHAPIFMTREKIYIAIYILYYTSMRARANMYTRINEDNKR